MTITIGWWILPLAITLIWLGHLFSPSTGKSGYGYDFGGIFKNAGLLILSLISWIIYLALT